MSYDAKLRRNIRGLPFFVVGALGIILIVAWSQGAFRSFRYPYMIPWIIVVAGSVASPAVYLILHHRFGLFHPLVYAGWSYFFPAFVVGGLMLAVGYDEPFFTAFINSPEHAFSLSLGYVALGFAGLCIGYSVPLARRFGRFIVNKIPRWDWHPSQLLVPCSILLIISQLATIAAFSIGALGFQSTSTVSVFGTTLTSLALLGAAANFLLWWAFFQTKRRSVRYYAVFFLLVAYIIYSAMLGGNRGALLSSIISILMAYLIPGRRIRLRQGAIITTLLIGVLLGGMIYGTSFRSMKTLNASIGLGEYFDVGRSTLSSIRENSLKENLTFGLDRLLERFENLSSLAVIVTNYKTLKPLEEHYGLANNIWTDTWTAFIPRFIWPNKPLVSNARAVATLYFNSSDNAFAITPIGDLLRNFGPIGIPLGMALLGFMLKAIYVALVQSKPSSAWHAVGFYMLLTGISYEGFFGSIFPGLIRVAVILFISGLLINGMVRLRPPN